MPPRRKMAAGKRQAIGLLGDAIRTLERRSRLPSYPEAQVQLKVAKTLHRIFERNPERELTDRQIALGLNALSQALTMGGVIPGKPGSAANRARRIVYEVIRRKPEHLERAMKLGLIDKTRASRILLENATKGGALTPEQAKFFGQWAAKGFIVEPDSLSEIIRDVATGKFDLKTLENEFNMRQRLSGRGRKRLSNADANWFYQEEIYTRAQATHVINLNMLFEAEESGRMTRHQRLMMEGICYMPGVSPKMARATISQILAAPRITNRAVEQAVKALGKRVREKS